MTCRRLLVIRYGGFGDAIQASSILPGLKSEGWRITWDASPMGEAVLRHDPHIDAIMVTPSGSVPSAALTDYWAARSNGFHRVINLCESVEATLLPTPEQLGFYHDDDARRRVYGGRNYVEHAHRIAGVTAPYRPWFFETDEEAAQAAEDIGTLPGVVLCLAGSAEYKIWPHAASFAVRLLASTTARLLLAGGERDAPLAAAVAEQVSMMGAPFAERLVDMTAWPIRRAIAAACAAEAVIGPETGILNAVAMRGNRKVVLLSHSDAGNLTRDWPNTAALAPPVPCHPCHRLHATKKFCPRGPSGVAAACAEAVTPEQVLAALGDVIHA